MKSLSFMKPVNRAMKDHPAYNRQTVYLFFFDQGTDAALAGYMPLNGRFGYITGFTAARQAEYYRTIAHEIAHVSDLLPPARHAAGGYKSQSRVLGSTFNLRHTFSKENRYVLPERSPRSRGFTFGELPSVGCNPCGCSKAHP